MRPLKPNTSCSSVGAMVMSLGFMTGSKAGVSRVPCAVSSFPILARPSLFVISNIVHPYVREILILTTAPKFFRFRAAREVILKYRKTYSMSDVRGRG